ncbi:MAG: glycogen/starch/alpha-glucan phosphorylase [Desulfurococcaceae archaeon]
MVIVSVTPEIALEELYTYAGGLGVLEGDKFYTAGRMGLEYVVFSIMYRRGYVDYVFDGETPVPIPQKHSLSALRKLLVDEEFNISLRGEEVIVRPWIYRSGSAVAILFEAVCPKWARVLTEQAYVNTSIEDQFLRYSFLAKATAYYIRERIGVENISIIDLQEPHTSLLLLTLPLEDRYRLIIHTPGPWGHPVFPGSLVSREFGAYISNSVKLTELALSKVKKAFVVSAKQHSLVKQLFPTYIDKISYVTNGIDLNRWMHPKLLKAFREGSIDESTVVEVKREAKKSLESLIRNYKSDVELGEGIVIAWPRRLAKYKRPYFVFKYIIENPDSKAFFVLAGKPHPMDVDGLKYAREFRKLHLRLRNVVFIHDYDLTKAKTILRGVDLLLFTPFSGWEACGTSYMKAGVNATPTLSSRDGGALELINDGSNGWLFGENLSEFIDIYNDPRAVKIDEMDYSEFSHKLTKLIEIYDSDKWKFIEVAVNALKTFPPKVDVVNALKTYYVD